MHSSNFRFSTSKEEPFPLNTHRKKTILSLSIILSIVVIAGAWFWINHPTHPAYNDRLIIGSTAEKIITEYGTFDKVFFSDENETELVFGGYLVEAPRVTNLGTTRPKYYMIRFENGIAVSVKLETGGWGG